MWFKGLHLVDFFSANPRRMADTLVERLGLVRPDAGLAMEGLGADGFYSTPNYGADTAFLRLSPWTAEALQVIGMRPLSDAEREHASETPLNSIYGVLPGSAAWQGDRPVKSHRLHAPIDDTDLLALVSHWEQRGIPWLAVTPNQTVPLPAIFPGWSGDPTSFDSSRVVLPWEWASPALFSLAGQPPIEDFLPMLQAMAAAMPAPQLAEGEAPDGALHAVLAQSFLVNDLDAALQSLKDDMLLDPKGQELVRESSNGIERARIVPETHGAAIELIQPVPYHGRTGRYFAAYGQGPFAVRLGTRSIDELARDLDSRGTLWFNDTESPSARRIVVDPASVGGAEIEIEEIA